MEAKGDDGQNGDGNFPSPVMFELLLKAREEQFVCGVPIRMSASPIDITIKQQCFYVYADQRSKVSRPQSDSTEICVKYNNCARSRVWWSPEHGERLGMVARKMGMRPRASNTSSGGNKDSGGESTKERHGYEGHWLALVERPNAGKVQDKRLIRDYILDKAPSIVQFWRKGEKADPFRFPKVPRVIPDSITQGVYEPRPAVSKFVGQQIMDFPGMENPETLDSSNSTPQGSPQVPPPYLSQSQVGVKYENDDASAEAFGHDAKISAEPGEMQPRVKIAYASIDESDGADFVDMETRDFYKPKRTRSNSRSSDLEDELVFLVDALEETRGHTEPRATTKDENSEVDPEQTSLEASLMAYEIFRNVCETFTPEEFKRWYDMYAKTLFLPNVARGLKYFMDRNDPRLCPEFMFSNQCSFLPEKPVCKLMYQGSYARGFKLNFADENTISVLELDAVDMSQPNIYEALTDSKMMLLCQHLFFKQLVAKGEINLSHYWFHTIVRLASGVRKVLRGRSIVKCHFNDVDKEIRSMELQDVSEEYARVLEMPPLPC
mmetsp:Transcript_1754/g.3446  ORF Transcript_1754/g.3446 Transcript_1754/m.3446 type:complete len:549 (+) Transcript_1754:336-1982(+)